MCLVTIDCREVDLIEIFKQMNYENYECKSIPLGDIIIGDNIIIERKTWADLASSIIDGRYKEQKGRILSQIEQNKICRFFYIIEGSNFNLKSYEKTIYQGALISISLRDNIHIIKTD